MWEFWYLRRLFEVNSQSGNPLVDVPEYGLLERCQVELDGHEDARVRLLRQLPVDIVVEQQLLVKVHAAGRLGQKAGARRLLGVQPQVSIAPPL